MPLTYLSRSDVRTLLPSPEERLQLVERTFAAIRGGVVQMPPKPAVTPRADSFIHAMPAYVGDGCDCAGIKWIGGAAGNKARGLPYLSGLIVLNDPVSAMPFAILDAAEITAARTAAVSALCLRWFAPAGPLTIAIVGCGEQGLYHAQLIRQIREDATVIAYDRHPERAAAIADHSLPSRSVREAVVNADVVISALPLTIGGEPAIETDWLKNARLLLPIDFDASFHADAILGSSAFLVDSIEQFEYFQGSGHFPGWPNPTTSLGHALDGTVLPPGRSVCCNLGVGALDVVFAGAVVALASQRGVGTRLEVN